MPTPRHGKNTRILCDGVTLSNVTQEVSQSAKVDSADTTVHGSTDKTCVAGHRDLSVSVTGIADSRTSTEDIDATAIEATLGSTGHRVLTIMPEGFSTGGRAALHTGFWNTYDLSAPANNVISFAGQFMAGSTSVQGSKDLFGQVIFNKALTASTSTGAGPTVDNTVASTGGFVLHVHVLSPTTNGLYKVQHSSNGSAWSDLSTALDLDGRGGRRVYGTGAVKRYVRGSFGRSSTGADPKFLLAFARR